MAREASLDRSRFEVDIGRHAPSVGLWSGLTLGLISAVGLVAFLYPLFLSGASRSDALGNPHADDAPLFFGLVLALMLMLFVLELGSQDERQDGVGAGDAHDAGRCPSHPDAPRRRDRLLLRGHPRRLRVRAAFRFLARRRGALRLDIRDRRLRAVDALSSVLRRLGRDDRRLARRLSSATQPSPFRRAGLSLRFRRRLGIRFRRGDEPLVLAFHGLGRASPGNPA